MVTVIVKEYLKCAGTYRHTGDVFDCEDELALELISRGYLALADEAAEEDQEVEVEQAVESEDEAEDEAEVAPDFTDRFDSAGTQFAPERHVIAKATGEPMLNKDGTWRNKPGTGTV